MSLLTAPSRRRTSRNMQTPPPLRLGKPLAHILFGLLLSASMYLPDALYGLANSQYSAHLSFMDGIALWLASLLLLGTPWRAGAYVIIALIAHLQLGQLLYFSYFGTHFHPQALGLLPSELYEIGLTLGSFIQHLWLPLALVLASALINAWLWHVSRGRVFASVHAPLVLLFLLAILPIRPITPRRPTTSIRSRLKPPCAIRCTRSRSSSAATLPHPPPGRRPSTPPMSCTRTPRRSRRSSCSSWAKA